MVDYTQLLITVCVILFIMYIQNCCNTQKTEHMTSINDEAVSMIASLYNGEKLIVNNLEVKGETKIGGSLEVGKAAIIGPAYIGGHNGNINDIGHAQFSHKDQRGANDFALLHRSDGMTWLNCKKDSQTNIENGRARIATIYNVGSTLGGTTTIPTLNATTLNATTLNANDINLKNKLTLDGNWKIKSKHGHLMFQYLNANGRGIMIPGDNNPLHINHDAYFNIN